MGTAPDSRSSDAGGEGVPPRADGAAATLEKTAVRYGAMNWVGEFTCKSPLFSHCGARLVVQTERGIELGQQLERFCGYCPASVTPEQIRRYVENSGVEFYRPNAGRILREATAQDVDEHYRLNAYLKEDIQQCAALAAERSLKLKVVTAEHLLGGERIVFYFMADGRVDFRELVKELARRYRTRIEMRQVGARDEARLLADWEVCGRECCCKNFLKTLRPVNMKMAKLQKSTLDPSKVSGRCGRLRCCLRYEHEGYVELAARLPRKGTRVATAVGEGTVIDTQVLTQLVLLRREDGSEFAVAYEEITAFKLPRPTSPPLPPSASPEPMAEWEPRTRPPRSGGPWPDEIAPAGRSGDAQACGWEESPESPPSPQEARIVEEDWLPEAGSEPPGAGSTAPDESSSPPGPDSARSPAPPSAGRPPTGIARGSPRYRRRRRRPRPGPDSPPPAPSA